MMSKHLRLLMVAMLAVLLLAACGAPAYVNEAAHEDAADADHAAGADDAATDDHADETAAEDEAAEEPAGESDAGDEDAAAETETEEPAAEDDPEAAADEETADEEAAAMDDAAHDHSDADTGDMEVEGDAASGEELFNTLYTEVGFACATCHNADSEERLIGPGLLNVKVHGAGHVEGLSVVEYLRQSIVEPNAYIVPDYPENLMPQTYSELLTEDQINDILAYLLTLEG